ncbi:MAG: hypothetical protein IH914_06805, partial [candidate division Zixibacteria bacterium]|nr:hypothetical protein [candidate division Zixibacteria bacterium]
MDSRAEFGYHLDVTGRIKTVGILGVLLVLVSLRFVNLESDPPLYFVGHGQDQLTDPYHLTFHARNQVLYDQWNPFGYHRWDVFKHSIVSAVAYGAFSLATPSRMVANVAALVLQLGGIALFLFGWRRLRGDREALIAAGLLLINSTLFFYGRLPFLENGLIFFCGLMFFVFVRYHDKLWGAALAGALVALAALAGKLFGALLMAPLLVTLFYQHRQLALKPVLCALGGFAGAGAVFILIVNGGQVTALMSYYTEQTVGMYGAPPGLSSVSNFFKMFATFGGESGLAEYTPALILLSLFSLILILVTTPEVFKFKSEFVPLVFAASWLIVGVLGLMPFLHRPMRYSLFLYLPMSALGAYALNLAWQTKVRFRIHLPWIALPLIWFTLLYTGTQVVISFAKFGDR